MLAKPREPAALAKVDAQRLQRAEMQQHQAGPAVRQEKLVIYERQHADTAVAFEKARGSRNDRQYEYDDRARFIAERVSDIQGRGDGEALRCLDGMKAYAEEFEAMVTQGKREWKKHLNKFHKEVSTRNQNIEAEIANLNAAITQERDDCLTHSAHEIEPLTEALAAHNANLEAQIAGRDTNHDVLLRELREQFQRLRGRLRTEQRSREQQCKDGREATTVQCAELAGKIKHQQDLLRGRLKALRENIEAEKTESVRSHEVVVDKMMHLMEEFEKNMQVSRGMAAETQKYLSSLRESLRTA